MDTFLAGAEIKVLEFPKLSATTDANGYYVLKVPDDANVTPYIELPRGHHHRLCRPSTPRARTSPTAQLSDAR